MSRPPPTARGFRLRRRDFGYLAKRPFFTREHVSGRTLEEAGRSVDPERLADLFAEVAGSLAYLHEHDVLHLDVKPSNIILARGRPRGRRTVLIDFGLWRRGGVASAAAKGRGSLPFMAPEYLRAEDLGPWTDVYALGVTFYRLATGAFPRPGAAARPGEDPWPGALVAPAAKAGAIDLGGDLGRILERCLALDPAASRLRRPDVLGAGPLPLIGREREIHAVERWLERRLQRGEGSAALLVTAPPGMGQSRFLEEVRARAQTVGIRCHLAVAHRHRPPPPGALLEAFRDPALEVPAQARRRWKKLLARWRRPAAPRRVESTDAERRAQRGAELAELTRPIRSPVLLLADGLQFFDEISIGVVLEWLRRLEEVGPDEAGQVAWGFAFREEGPSAPLLREISREVMERERDAVISLRPLGALESRELFCSLAASSEVARSPGTGASSALALWQASGGVPARIVEAAGLVAGSPSRGEDPGGAAGARRALARHGPEAAAYLRSTGQSRHALEVLGDVLDVLGAGRAARRAALVIDMADLHVRLGDFDGGTRRLRELLADRDSLPRAARWRAVLRLAALHGRRGDYPRAEALFREGLREARRRGSGVARADLLFALDECASVKAFTGQYEDALRLCEEGLRLAGRRWEFEVRELALGLHATRANVAARRLELEEATREYERALAMAEAIGSRVDQAAILANLGIVYGQCDRYEEALGALGEAERHAMRLDEGPSLASIRGNLAIVRARRGQFEEAEQALSAAASGSKRDRGPRQELFLTHARGLVRLWRGRFSEALPALDEALRLARAMGDRHVAAFDAVYRAEALLFLGKSAEAEGAFSECIEGAGESRPSRMALARRAPPRGTLARASLCRAGLPGAIAPPRLAGQRARAREPSLAARDRATGADHRRRRGPAPSRPNDDVALSAPPPRHRGPRRPPESPGARVPAPPPPAAGRRLARALPLPGDRAPPALPALGAARDLAAG